MNLRPVSVGDKVLPRLADAEWFNQTLPKPKNKKGKKRGVTLVPGEYHCVGKEGMAKVAPLFPVGIIGSKVNTDNRTGRRTVLEVSGDNSDISNENWVVTSEFLEGGKTSTVYMFGIVPAVVNIIDPNDTHVEWDPDNNELRSNRSGRAVLLIQDVFSIEGDSYSYLYMGNHIACTEVVGTASTTISADCSDYSIGNLQGINAPAAELGASIMAKNIHQFEADSGAIVYAHWVHDLREWHIRQVDCSGTTPCTLT